MLPDQDSKGNSYFARCDTNRQADQLQAIENLEKEHAGEEEEEDNKAAQRLFVLNFEYQSEYDMFCEEFMHKSYKVDGSF